MTSACLINLLPKEILLNTCHLKPINFQNIMICEAICFNFAIFSLFKTKLKCIFLLQYPKLSRVVRTIRYVRHVNRNTSVAFKIKDKDKNSLKPHT